jgi:uncharacterized membrane-anchored protein YjiN (DUF445 family)
VSDAAPAAAPPRPTWALEEADEQRRRDLIRARRRATGLFVVVVVAYFSLRIGVDDRSGTIGYVVAFFEAAMVGALADWFAVTALFRHPWGVPVPHTAIIPNRKEQIGRSLGDFVQQNFLNGDVLGSKLHEAGLAARLGAWLAEPDNAERVGAALGDSLGGLSDAVAGENLRAAVNDTVLQQARATPVAPLVGRGIDLAIEGGHHKTLFDAILRGSEDFLDEQRTELRGRLDQESPWWVPEPIDDRIFDKIYNGVTLFLREVGSDPDHPIRSSFDERITGLVRRLEDDPELVARGEAIKNEVLDHPEMSQWTSRLWDNLQASVVADAGDPQSSLRLGLRDVVAAVGERLQGDVQLQAKLDDFLVDAVIGAIDQFRGEISQVIAATVDTWDADETSERLELLLGPDLQFIRINGTLVGGTAGVLIHASSELLG